MTQSSTRPTTPTDAVHIALYDANGSDRKLSIDEVDPEALGDQNLLWIDVAGEDHSHLEDLGARLGLGDEILDLLTRRNGMPHLRNFGDRFALQAVAVANRGELEFGGLVLGIAAGPNFVLTIHAAPIPFIDELRTRERGETTLGVLSEESFTASLLDWQLQTYLEAVSDFEAAVERLELGILGGRAHRLAELQALRRSASRLRRMLAPHRRLFGGLARPDFRPRQDGEPNVHFQTLDTHFERAMDTVENARELVVGSFELFTSQTAWRTNRTIQALTFYTVLLGFLAVVSGVFGMNFSIDFFARRPHGFWVVVASMLGVALVASAVARKRNWL
jgi:magnesium transporter